MSDGRSSERALLNWRGPLLAAGIFAGVFAILLLMAHQNEANTTDEGSSFRQDPFGTSLLFDAYERAGYRVERSEDEESLADEDAAQTTAFFVGGTPPGVTSENDKAQAGPKFTGMLENFLARGGRVVLVNGYYWGLSVKSASQGWDIETDWVRAKTNDQRVSQPQRLWASPVGMPEGSEGMYLFGLSPWLKIDSHWTTLYEGTDGGALQRPYMAMRPAGKGELIVASQQSFLLNEAVKTHPNPVMLDFLAGGRHVIWVDEPLHGLQQEQGVLWLVHRYRLQAALLFFWATLLALLWSMSGDLVRRAARDRSGDVIRHGENAGVAGQRLLRRCIGKDRVLVECWEYFRRRSPQDAYAISEDPAYSKRLRDALQEQPVAGYTQLRDLIAERRASAKIVRRGENEARQKSFDSSKTTPEEAGIA